LNGVLGQIGPGRDAGLRPEKALNASALPTRRMGVAGSMEVPALAQEPRMLFRYTHLDPEHLIKKLL